MDIRKTMDAMTRDLSRDIEWPYADAPDRERMRPTDDHRRPTTDQLRARRRINRTSSTDREDTPVTQTQTPAELMARAARATDPQEQRQLVAQAAAVRTRAEADARWASLTEPETPEPVMRAEASAQLAEDASWYFDPTSTAPDLHRVGQEMVVQASRWFDKVPDDVKSVEPEFVVQASSAARHIAAQIPGLEDNRDAVVKAFTDEANRLHTLAVATGGLTLDKGAIVWDDLGVSVPAAPMSTTASTTAAATGDWFLDATEYAESEHERIDRLATFVAADETEDGEGSDDESTAADGEKKTAASTLPQVGETTDPSDPAGGAGTSAPMDTLQGSNALPGDMTSSMRAPVWAELQQSSPISVPENGAQAANGSGPDGSRDAAGSQSGIDHSTFPVRTQASISSTEPREGYQQKHEYTCPYDGCDEHAVIPGNKAEAEHYARDHEKIHAQSAIATTNYDQHLDHHFNPKEAAMGDQNQSYAACPSCGGHGKVPVRKITPVEAASNLPQIDQLVDGQERPAKTPLPPEVAFGFDTGGWGENDPRAQVIAETEQQIADRNGRSPLPGMGGRNPGVMGSRRPVRPPSALPNAQANGRDNGGWIDNMDGQRGTDYPGYSDQRPGGPPSQLGQPDPVYNYGGDQGDRQLKPHGDAETADVTNGSQANSPGYGIPLANDQGFREVTPAMGVQGSLDATLAGLLRD